jgi:hypothetical protein
MNAFKAKSYPITVLEFEAHKIYRQLAHEGGKIIGS